MPILIYSDVFQQAASLNICLWCTWYGITVLWCRSGLEQRPEYGTLINICARWDSPFSTIFVFMLDIYQKYVLRIWYRVCLDGKVQSLGSIEPTTTVLCTVCSRAVRPAHSPVYLWRIFPKLLCWPHGLFTREVLSIDPPFFFAEALSFPIFTKPTLWVYFVAYSYFRVHVIFVYRIRRMIHTGGNGKSLFFFFVEIFNLRSTSCNFIFCFSPVLNTIILHYTLVVRYY